MKENSRKDIQEVDELIKKCDECKLNECINCEISWTEVVSIKKITDEYKKILKMNEVLLKENEILKEEKEQAWEEWNNLEQGSYETEQKLKQQIKKLQKEKKELELEIKNRKFSHMNLYNEYKYYKQFKSLSIETIKNKIEYLDKQQADWIEDRELKVSDSEIIFARDTLEKLLEDNYEKF